LARPHCLLLCHRIPHPPDRGDKIRSHHLLRYLAGRYQVHLGAFVDDPHDWARADELGRYTVDRCLRPLPRWRVALRAGIGLLRGEALTVAAYRDRALARWVDERLPRMARVVTFSSAMARFVDGRPAPHLVHDFVDVDSEKWRAYAERASGPKAWLYRREVGRLLDFERRAARQAERVLFISPEEADLFRARAGADLPIDHYPNGVDVDYFDPARAYPDPFPAGTRQLVFTGVMDYPPNEDAVRWFAEAVFPALRRDHPDLGFTIVGARPGEAVRALEARPGITVTGRVPDVRPYLAHAFAAVAPMRVARGVQNKVLEAMAMDRPVLTTRAGAEGLGADVGAHIAIADEAEDQRRILHDWLAGAETPRPRAYVLEHFSWDGVYARLDRLLGEGGP